MTSSDAVGTERPAEGRLSQQQVDIVRYWRLLELFSPQRVDRPDPGNGERPITDHSAGRRLPWDTSVPPAPGRSGRGGPAKAKVWQHTVYLGVYEIEAVYQHLRRIFPRDQDAHDERPPGSSACAVIVVDAEGRMIEDSAVLSSASWGVGRSIDPGVAHPGWSTGLEEAQEQFCSALAERLSPPRAHGAGTTTAPRTGEDGDAPAPQVEARVGPRIDGSVLQDLVHLAHRAAGLVTVDGAMDLSSVATTRVRIASALVNPDTRGTPPGTRPDFLNSFLLEDLAVVADSAWGPALREYLTPAADVPVAERVDVRASPESVAAGTRIERLPAGRWLSDPDVHLSSSQQFAVDEAFASLGTSCHLLGVNGPPGTGKTTMLRDVLAANVVGRAEVLAALDSPAQAFASTTHEWKAGNYKRRLRGLRPEVTGFEMLLASSNNGAVQNVSDELPQRKTIHDPEGVADYFADLASEVEHRQRTRPEDRRKPRTPTWGLVAARLGNSTNRGNFNSALWFGAGPQGAPAPPDPDPVGTGATNEPDAAPTVVLGMLQLLKNWEADEATRPSWQRARDTFARARAHVTSLTTACLAAQSRGERLTRVVEEIVVAQGRVEELDARARDRTKRRESVEREISLCSSAAEGPARRYQRHLDSEPGGWEKLFDRKTTRAWRQKLTTLQEQLDAAEAAVDSARSELRELDETIAGADRVRGDAAATLALLDREGQDLRRRVEEDAATWGEAHPSGAWLDDPERRELHAAWLDHDLDEARSQLFLAALALHRSWWAGVPDVRRDLQACLDVVTGAAPRTLTPQARHAAWQLLFLLTPLVSTTFASVGRMLHGLGPHTLGWLLIDEAGQATPQAAVGAVWRAQRVLAVGDPLQLTPVVTVPRPAQEDLAASFSVAPDWIPSTTSVQQVADRVGRYGTTLTNGSEPLWVSAPLRVHRRCAEPMFSICNAIAYDDFMVSAVGDREDPVPSLPSSRWLDVPAVDTGTHLQRAEIRKLRAVLDDVGKQGLAMSHVIAVSPFRQVADALGDVRKEHPGLVAGTVHTAQGKEADVVFFVLGGDPASRGAKVWASATPNLVNVAVSRAKHRLYVIGDRRAWRVHPFFSELDRALAEHESGAT